MNCYVQGNPVSLADQFGLCPDGNSTMQGLAGSLANATEELLGVGKRLLNSNTYGHSVLARIGNYWHMANVINVAWYIAESDYETISTYGHAALDLVGIVWDGADFINAVWYAAEGNYDMAVVSGICALPFVGNIVGGSAGMAMKFVGHSLTIGVGLKGTVEAVDRAVDAYENGKLSWWNALDIGLNALTVGFAGVAAYSCGSKLSKMTDGLNNGGYLNLGAFKSGMGSNTYYHSCGDNVADIIANTGFKTDIPDEVTAFYNNRYGRGGYLADSPTTALAERPGGTILKVIANPGRNLDLTSRGVIGGDDYTMTHAIARGARKHGYDSITFISAKNPNGINTVIFNPSNIQVTEVMR